MFPVFTPSDSHTGEDDVRRVKYQLHRGSDLVLSGFLTMLCSVSSGCIVSALTLMAELRWHLPICVNEMTPLRLRVTVIFTESVVAAEIHASLWRSLASFALLSDLPGVSLCFIALAELLGDRQAPSHFSSVCIAHVN